MTPPEGEVRAFRPLASLVASVGAIAIAILATAISHPGENFAGSACESEGDGTTEDEPAPEPSGWLVIDGREAAQGETKQAACELIVAHFVQLLRRRNRWRRWRRRSVWPPDLAALDDAILDFELAHASTGGARCRSLEAFAEEKCRTLSCYRSAYIDSFTAAVRYLDPAASVEKLQLDAAG